MNAHMGVGMFVGVGIGIGICLAALFAAGVGYDLGRDSVLTRLPPVCQEAGR